MDIKLRTLTFSAALMLIMSACTIGTSDPNNPVNPEPPLFPSVEMIVQADPSTPINTVGQIVQYTYNIKNNGTEPIPGVVSIVGAVNPPQCPAITTIGDGDEFLDPEETIPCVSSYSVTQADLDSGSITTVTSANVNGIFSNPATTTLTAAQDGKLSLTKSASPTTYDRIGQTINYTYVVTNNGSQDIGPAQFVVTDSGISTPLNCGNENTTIPPNQTVTCSIPYIVTQADMDAGTISTSATVSGGGVGPSEPASATVTKTAGSNLTPGSTIQHKVLDGEWLWQISRCYGADPKATVLANRQLPNPALIEPGTIVTVPNIGSHGKIYQTNPPVPCIAWHTVKSGETWSSIAQNYNANLTVLQMVNKNSFGVGVVLKVPINSADGSVVSPPPTSTATCVDLIRTLELAETPPHTTHFDICGLMNANALMNIETIRVYQRVEDVGSGGFSQTITLPAAIDTVTPLNNANSMLVGDMNYDGNDDFRVARINPVGDNITYVYYLFDPGSRTFVYNEAYGVITSPEFPGSNQVLSNWTDNTGKWGIDTYVITNNNPVRTRRETWEPINETQAKHQILEYNADGSSVVTVDEIVTISAP